MKGGDAFYHSQSAKSVNRDKKKDKQQNNSIQDIIDSKKKLLSGEGDDDEEGITVMKRTRKASEDTEDLEASSSDSGLNASLDSNSPTGNTSKKLYQFKQK